MLNTLERLEHTAVAIKSTPFHVRVHQHRKQLDLASNRNGCYHTNTPAIIGSLQPYTRPDHGKPHEIISIAEGSLEISHPFI